MRWSVAHTALCRGTPQRARVERSLRRRPTQPAWRGRRCEAAEPCRSWSRATAGRDRRTEGRCARSEEHTSELQSRGHLVCRLLLEKKQLYAKKTYNLEKIL